MKRVLKKTGHEIFLDFQFLDIESSLERIYQKTNRLIDKVFFWAHGAYSGLGFKDGAGRIYTIRSIRKDHFRRVSPTGTLYWFSCEVGFPRGFAESLARKTGLTVIAPPFCPRTCSLYPKGDRLLMEFRGGFSGGTIYHKGGREEIPANGSFSYEESLLTGDDPYLSALIRQRNGGDGVKAYNSFFLAAEQGDPDANFKYGAMRESDGNLDEAIQYYKNAAKGGNEEAILKLGEWVIDRQEKDEEIIGLLKESDSVWAKNLCVYFMHKNWIPEDQEWIRENNSPYIQGLIAFEKGEYSKARSDLYSLFANVNSDPNSPFKLGKYYLGVLNEMGWGGKKDHPYVKLLYKSCVDLEIGRDRRGNFFCSSALDSLTKGDLKTAEEELWKARGLGVSVPSTWLRLFYAEKQKGVKVEERTQILSFAAEGGLKKAELELAKSYLKKRLNSYPSDPRDGLKIVEELAAKGYSPAKEFLPQAELALGRAWFEFFGKESKYGWSHIEKAAQGGNAEAIKLLKTQPIST
ncbi:MAG TPA: hypothetical protein VLE89_04075 [Chlamydiales bacterium]|nr:hypothetical protein [Chlamydiales bacterium]